MPFLVPGIQQLNNSIFRSPLMGRHELLLSPKSSQNDWGTVNSSTVPNPQGCLAAVLRHGGVQICTR